MKHSGNGIGYEDADVSDVELDRGHIFSELWLCCGRDDGTEYGVLREFGCESFGGEGTWGVIINTLEWSACECYVGEEGRKQKERRDGHDGVFMYVCVCRQRALSRTGAV